MRTAGAGAIEAMPEAYNLISNNCQTFVIGLVKLISPDANMSNAITIQAVVEHVEAESTDPKEVTQAKIELVKSQNMPATNAAAIMESITPVKGA
jgi:hypothetical protein